MPEWFSKLIREMMLPALAALFPLLVNSQPSHGPVGSEMERTFQAAMAAEERGDVAQAETLLTALHKAHPGIFAVNESLGLLLASRGELSRALPLLEAAAHEQPSSDVAHANLGAALYQAHRSQPALEEFELAVKINPANASALQSLGRLCMENEKPDEAARSLLAAEHLKPDDANLKLDCVVALLAANRVGEAQNMLSTFADADRSAPAQSLLGEACEKQGKSREAAEHFAHAASLNPSEENVWQLGVEFLRHWVFDAAAAEFEAASLKFPDSKRMRLGLGAALFGEEKYEKAVPVFADLLENDPDNPMIAGLLGISCDARTQASSPRCAALIAYAQSHPSDAEAATYAAASIMAENGEARNVDLARKLMERALTASPNSLAAQLEMGVVLQDGLDWKGSVPYLERALKLKPDLAQAHYRLALAYFRTGRKQDGQTQMELQKKFARQDQEDLARRLREMTTFVVKVH